MIDLAAASSRDETDSTVPDTVLLCHNYYQQPGGEDASFEDEARLLEDHGHRVVRYTRHNSAIERLDPSTVAVETIWSRRTRREVDELIAQERPDVVHFTNTFPLISPSAFAAARDAGVPVVKALRNYRLTCPSAVLYRDGRPCEACLGRAVPWPGVLHGCYRDSRAASAVVAAMIAVHRARGTWTREVDLYYAPSAFARDKYAEAGFDPDRIRIKPNFVDPDPGEGSGGGGYAVFVGRHAPEKGLGTLLEAWSRIPDPIPLKLVGDGPLADDVAAAARADQRIEWVGRRSVSEVLDIVGEAAFLVMPSEWYETFGRTIVEAFAKGTPALVAGFGAMAELVEDGVTGLYFTPGDAADLSLKARSLMADAGRRSGMRRAARRTYLERFTAEANYATLLDIYRAAARNRSTA